MPSRAYLVSATHYQYLITDTSTFWQWWPAKGGVHNKFSIQILKWDYLIQALVRFCQMLLVYTRYTELNGWRAGEDFLYDVKCQSTMASTIVNALGNMLESTTEKFWEHPKRVIRANCRHNS